jgi:hypothetical protein
MKDHVERIKVAEDADTVATLASQFNLHKSCAAELRKSLKKVVEDLKANVKRRAAEAKKQEGRKSHVTPQPKGPQAAKVKPNEFPVFSMDFSQYPIPSFADQSAFVSAKNAGKVAWDLPILVNTDFCGSLEDAAELQSTLVKFAAQFPASEQAKKEVSGRRNAKAQAPMASSSAAQVSARLKEFAQDLLDVTGLVKSADQTWLFGMCRDCRFVENEPIYQAQLRAFTQGMLQFIWIKSSDVMGVVSAQLQKTPDLGQLVSYIENLTQEGLKDPSVTVTGTMVRAAIVDKPVVLYTPPGSFVCVRVLNSSEPVGIRIGGSPSLRTCTSSKANLEALATAARETGKSASNPLLEEQVNRIAAMCKLLDEDFAAQGAASSAAES